MDIARAFPNTDVLQLTYNAALKREVRAKVEELKVGNLDVHNYHAFAYHYYDKDAYTDERLKTIVENDCPSGVTRTWSIVVIDECQDLTYLYYQFINKILRDAPLALTDVQQHIQIVLMGDDKQGVYEFRGTDRRYLTLGNQIFIDGTSFVDRPLTTSYRLPRKIALFVSKVMCNNTVSINSNHDEPLPVMLCEYTNNDTLVIDCFERINSLLNKTARIQDIFVLVPSVNHGREVKRIANELTNISRNVVASLDQETLTDEIMLNKLVITTYHQSKGRERDFVFLLGFDNSYFKYYNKDDDPSKCSSPMYVAATRAKKQLILMGNVSHGRLPFLNMNQLEIEVNQGNVVWNRKDVLSKDLLMSSRPCIRAVTQLLKYLSVDLLAHVDRLLEFKTIRPPSVTKEMSFVIHGETHEYVANMIGNAIPMMYFGRSKPNENWLKAILGKKRYKKYMIETMERIIKSTHKSRLPYSAFFCASAMHETMSSGYDYKFAQIHDFNWMTDNDIEPYMTDMRSLLDTSIEHQLEVEITKKLKIENTDDTIIVNGRMDYVDDNYLYEFKCVESLTTEHKLQLALYSFMMKDKKTARLYNIRTGEVLELVSKPNDAVYYLLREHFKKRSYIDDDQFVSHCLGV